MSKLTVVAGLHRRSNANSGTVQRRRVARFFNHEQYNDVTQENDVAIIRLGSPMQLNDYVNVACLPGREPAATESVMIGACAQLLPSDHLSTPFSRLAGWGTTSYGGSPSDVLLQAMINIMETCRSVYKFDPSKQVCAGNAQYTKDSCQGDSGGPLMNEVGGQWYVSGIVSYGEECAKQNYPGVYARVSYYLPWIRSKVATP